MGTPLLRLAEITKSFGGVRALTRGDLELHAGEVTALLGENGAGKSTLVKILSGVQRCDAGVMELDGRPVEPRSPRQAGAAGISVIHQHSVVFDNLSIAENLFAADPPRRLGLIDWPAMHARSNALLARLGSNLDSRRKLGELSIAEKHLVQIARALSTDARIVIMDEPTAALSYHETEELLTIVRSLKAEGRAVLYITHKLEEVLAIADRYAVLRDGATVGMGNITDTTLESLVKLMVGRPVADYYPKVPVQPGPVALEVRSLGRGGEFSDLSFTVRSGEILGVYGLVGAGRSEAVQSLFGISPADQGVIRVAGAEIQPRRPMDMIARRVAYVPEDRQSQGAILSRSIADNVALSSLSQLSTRGLASPKREREVAREWIRLLQIKCEGATQLVQDLSGGNQQKVVVARWLNTKPLVLILDEPTKGIDVGSKAAMHRVMSDLVQQGLAIIMVSSDLPEVLGMSDSVLVMRRGRVSGHFDRAAATPDIILRAAMDA
jgi:rhamnose transport system ATP-binding protein